MNVPELALHHQRLDQRAGHLRAQIARLEAQLASDPTAERLDQARAEAETARREVELRLREREREAEDRGSRLRSRERELMSGRIRNPAELMKLTHEVEHLKAVVGEYEEAALELMEEQEGLETELARLRRELEDARARTAAAAPEQRARLERLEADLAQVQVERDAAWQDLPADWRLAYRRVRVADPVAEVVHGQCQACRVAVTSNGIQVLRRAGLLQCDNCGRLLVRA
jgi:predicted  nucleic acid-binding Zn-ribbon protein